MGSELIAWRLEAGRFADVRLMAELDKLARVDRRCEARILVLLAEADERQLHLAQGYSSLFSYAVSVLRMSGDQTYLRIGAARVARRYPLALEMLLEGALSLSTVKLLAPKLTDENHATLLERARGKTKEEVALLIAEIAPKPDVPTRIRKMPARAGRTSSAQSELLMSAPTEAQETSVAPSIAPAAVVSHAAAPHCDAATAAAAVAMPVAPAAVAPRVAAALALEAPRASCAALSPGRYKLELTVDQALFDQMMALKHLLKHRVPGGDLGVVLGLAITEFSGRLRKQRFAELSKPASGARAKASRNNAPEATSARASHDAAPTAEPGFSQRRSRIEHGVSMIKRHSRYVPRAVVREVFARDGAQCTFASADGRRCAEREMLELHHVKAFAHGGTSTPDNLKVVCRAHNGFFATQDFGSAHMRMMRVKAG